MLSLVRRLSERHFDKVAFAVQTGRFVVESRFCSTKQPRPIFDVERDTQTIDGSRNCGDLLKPLHLAVSMDGGGVSVGDGTFEYVPAMFKQMYSINATISGVVFPVVFVFKEKTTQAYEIVFTRMKENGATFKIVMRDYEKNVMVSNRKRRRAYL